MNCRASITVLFLALLVAAPSLAQVLAQPAPAPIVTAENERWYLEGDPISFAGNLYYQAGAQVFFNPNEMVRSGFHMGVPLYTRTTIEPFSVVFVPLAGGRMQPYERPRSGQLVGTSGSQPSSLVTPYDPSTTAHVLPQAGGPPLQIDTPPVAMAPRPSDPTLKTRPLPTTGGTPYQPMHTRIGGKPQGINAVFIDYDRIRWYSAGKAVAVDRDRMERIGDFKGFDVWRDRDSSGEVIYVASTRDGHLVVPYSRNKRIPGPELRGPG